MHKAGFLYLDIDLCDRETNLVIGSIQADLVIVVIRLDDSTDMYIMNLNSTLNLDMRCTPTTSDRNNPDYFFSQFFNLFDQYS